jgi:hypothetical protein
LGAEFAGGGIIDPERNRWLDFFFRIPTESRNVIYSMDQRFYVGVGENDWKLDLGDTVYTLTPLTQRSFLGRGIGLDAFKDPWSFGAHFCQNIFNNDYNPRQTCLYIDYSPLPWIDLGLNYMHKELQETPTTNIVTLSSELQFPKEGLTEIEFGKNFVTSYSDHSTEAFRFASNGGYGKDSWYDIEKVYAGAEFFGYYQHIDLFSSTLDFPLRSCTRGTLSYTLLKQNFDLEYDSTNGYPLLPRQEQVNGTINHTFNSSTSLSINGLWLRAKDRGKRRQYHFNQLWGGFSLNVSKQKYLFVGNCSFGQQQNYLTGGSSTFLQQYNLFLSKDFYENITSTLFYEGGNTNYYDAEPWRSSVGGSIRFCYGRGSFMELYLQRVNHSPDRYQLNQVTYNLNHFFKNLHSLQASVQYFHYSSHYPSDFLFLVSYTIPFNVSVGRRKDIGILNGSLFDSCSQTPVANTWVTCHGLRSMTDEEGRFSFRSLPAGEHTIKAEMLPNHLISQQSNNQRIHVVGGKNNFFTYLLTPTCSLEGDLLLFVSNDSLDPFNEKLQGKTECFEQQGVKGVEIFIMRDGEEEIHSVLTDSKGHYCFSKLRPGNWVVWVPRDQIPNFHDLNFNDLIIEINPGEERKIDFQLKPQPRKIQFLN